MKAGDIVRVRDGSYAMTIEPCLFGRIDGTQMFEKRYLVLAANLRLPTDNTSGHGECNDVLLLDTSFRSKLICSQERFCEVVNSAPTQNDAISDIRKKLIELAGAIENLML